MPYDPFNPGGSRPIAPVGLRQPQRSRGRRRKPAGLIRQRPYRSTIPWPWGTVHELSKRLGVSPDDIARARECGLLVESEDFEVEGVSRNGRRQFVYHLRRIEERWPRLRPLVAESYRVGVLTFRKHLSRIDV